MESEKIRITEEIVHFVHATEYDDFHQDLLEIAKRCIIDGIGVILAGSTEPCTRIALDHVLSIKGGQESSILGKGKYKAPAHLAAMVAIPDD